MARYWVAVASRDHVHAAVNGGFFQTNHGKEAPLKRIVRGDWVLFYSPRERMASGAPIQAFTAIGEVVDDASHRATQSATFQPFRRTVRYDDCRDAAIRPLLGHLSFSRSRSSWGQALRRGFLEIERADFAVIAAAMAGEQAKT